MKKKNEYLTISNTIQYLLTAFTILLTVEVFAVDDDSYIKTSPGDGRFTLVENGQPIPIYYSEKDHPGISTIISHFQNDFKLVTGIQPPVFIGKRIKHKKVIIIGSIDKSPLIKDLIRTKKIDASSINGKWETFQIQSIKNPFRGVDEALVICGSDKRGTIYGMFDLSSKIGVSPWYWWADVPVVKQQNLYVLPGIHSSGEPKVKYRGIFINDEAPALSGWVHENYGGVFNHEFYAKVFELILRMKGNYLWPAMWGRAFYDDDPKNPEVATEYGIVIGTTHHEPLMRAHVEWSRYGEGDSQEEM